MKEKVTMGQEAKLNKLVKRTIVTLVVGALLLVASYMSSFGVSIAYDQQAAVAMALNQYRLGSKALTYAVQSYSVAGNEQYYEDYIFGLNYYMFL